MAAPSDAEQLEPLAERALEAALAAGASAAEAYAQDSIGVEIRVYEGEVESLSEAAERGLGVRTWIDGRAGYGYATDLSSQAVAELAAGAVEMARATDPDTHAVPPPARGAAEGIDELSDRSLLEWTTERKIGLARAIEAAARGSDRRVKAVEQTVYADSTERAAIASSSGARGAYESTSCYAYLQAIAAGEAGDRQTGLGFGVGRAPRLLDAEAIGREAAERAVALLGAGKPRSRSCPVVLDATVAASFVGVVGRTLCADAVQRGRSPFAGRLGEQVAAPALSVTDDGLDPEGPASAPFDGEGIARGRTALIERGRLAAYLHDSYTAARAGEASTGNASRSGYRTPPSVSTSNLVIAPGDAGLEALVREAADGVYVTDVVGLHSGVNPVSGSFSVGASGRMIAGGTLADPVSEFTIASNLEAMLGAVVATGSGGRWVPFGGSVKAVPLLIGEMAIGGE